MLSLMLDKEHAKIPSKSWFVLKNVISKNNPSLTINVLVCLKKLVLAGGSETIP